MGKANDAEAEKATREIRVFREFAERSGLPIDPTTVQNRPPPERGPLPLSWLSFAILSSRRT